jgi:hypothetical protein
VVVLIAVIVVVTVMYPNLWHLQLRTCNVSNFRCITSPTTDSINTIRTYFNIPANRTASRFKVLVSIRRTHVRVSPSDMKPFQVPSFEVVRFWIQKNTTNYKQVRVFVFRYFVLVCRLLDCLQSEQQLCRSLRHLCLLGGMKRNPRQISWELKPA